MFTVTKFARGRWVIVASRVSWQKASVYAQLLDAKGVPSRISVA